MGRRVTVRLCSMCGTPFVHQNILIQLSSGEHWIPPDGPIQMPPGKPGDREGGKNSPKLSVRKVADALRQAVSSAASGAAQVSDVSSVSVTDGIYQTDEKGNKRKTGSAAVFEFSFTTKDNEIDFSMTGVKVDSNGKPVRLGKTQLAMAVVVDEGDGELEVKPVEAKDVIARATSSRSRRKAPGVVVPKKRRKKLKSGAGGSYGDKRLFPMRKGSAKSAFWSLRDEHAAFWEWDGLDVEDWAARMELGTPSPELSEPALDADDDALGRQDGPELATSPLRAAGLRRTSDVEPGAPGVSQPSKAE